MIAPATPLYVLDTNILIAYTRVGKLGQRIEATYQLLAASRPPLISIVTEGEVRSLAPRNNWGAAKQQQRENLLGTLLRVSLDAPRLIAAYADIDAYSERRGRSMGKNDVKKASPESAPVLYGRRPHRDCGHRQRHHGHPADDRQGLRPPRSVLPESRLD